MRIQLEKYSTAGSDLVVLESFEVESRPSASAGSFGGERNKIARRYRWKGMSWLGDVLVTE